MHDHTHRHNHLTKHALIVATVLAFSFGVIEALAGVWSQSLALLSDAGHMMSDALALALAAIAAWIAQKPPSDKHTYGLGRAEILGAWISSLLVLIVALVIIIEAIERIRAPMTVSGGVVILTASVGILINTFIAWVLSHGENTLNIRAAILHVMSDLAGAVAALIAGTVIYFTGWTPIDPILSIFISFLILLSSFRLLRESLKVLMEGVPTHIDVNQVGKAMVNINKVQSIHDLHIWTLSSGVTVLTAHVEIDTFDNWQEILNNLRFLLSQQFGIEHVTLQPELSFEILHHIPRGPGK